MASKKSVRTGRRNTSATLGSKQERPPGRTPAAASRDYTLPGEVALVIEAQRVALEIVVTLLTSLDATLQQTENDTGDILDPNDPVQGLILKARTLSRPIDLVRMAIQRIYDVHSKLDSTNLELAAAQPAE